MRKGPEPEPGYVLHYWPGLPGRGEFVRLTLEAAAADYRDVAQEGGDGPASPMWEIDGKAVKTPGFAPPILCHGELVIGQTANILAYLGPRHDLAPDDQAGRLWLNQLQLTLADWVLEIHDTHHPIASGLYYEDQSEEAARRTEEFLLSRLPKFRRETPLSSRARLSSPQRPPRERPVKPSRAGRFRRDGVDKRPRDDNKNK